MTNPRPRFAFPAVAPHRVVAAAGARRLVIVAPHPDDETLGCGRLIHAAVRTGVKVAVVALTDGDASHPGSRRWPPPRLATVRRAELRRALARLGAGGVPLVSLGWPDGAVARAGKVAPLRRALSRLRPGLVLAASPRDHHPDHQAGYRLVVAAARALGVPVVAYAVWSRVDAAGPRAIGAASAAKAWAIAAHRSQVGGYIADAPEGFRLTPALLARFVRGPERFTPVRPTRAER